jgi:MarR family transcriptional regulator, 2-MHQ and catechol-resistance regulon repressor
MARLSQWKVGMTPKPTDTAEQTTLLAQVTEPADQPYIDAARALIKVGFHFPNHPKSAYQTYDLNLAQVDVLIALAGAPKATLNCSEIAEKTLITKGGITGVLDKLEVRGLVRRMPSRDDRRSTLVRLTAKGVEFFRKFYPELVRRKRAFFEKAFRPDQMKEFGKLLDLLLGTLEVE